MNRDFKGVWIEKELYLDTTLSWTEKILMVEINSLDHGEGAWAGNDHYAEFLGISEGQTANLISKLRKKGIIVDRKSDGRKRWISVMPQYGFSRRTEILEDTLNLSSGKPESRVQEKLNEFQGNMVNDGLTGTQIEDEATPSNTMSNTNSSEVPKTEPSQGGFTEFMANLGTEMRSTGQEDENGVDVSTWYLNDKPLSRGKINDFKRTFEYQKRPKTRVVKKKVEWSFADKLKELADSPLPRNRIIVMYWVKKGFNFDLPDTWDAQYSRDIRAAIRLEKAKYSREDIQKSLNYCAFKYGDVDWKLETVVKSMAQATRPQ